MRFDSHIKVIDMNKIHKPLSGAQLYLLRLFAWCDTDEEVNEVKEVLLAHFQERVDEGLARLREEGRFKDESETYGMLYAHERISSPS